MKRGQLSRADLLKALVKSGQQVQDTLARELGLELQPEEISRDNKEYKSTSQSDTTREKVLTAKLKRSRTAELRWSYWQLVGRKSKKKESEGEEQPTEEVILQLWPNRPSHPPSYPALTTLEDFRTRLFPLLFDHRLSNRDIDLDAAVEKISRAEYLAQFPRKQQHHSPQTLHVIDDRQSHLVPYWLDHSWITLHLADEFGEQVLNRAVILEGDVQPTTIFKQELLQDYQLPLAGLPVLILSDLGRLSPGSSGHQSKWNRRQRLYWQLIRQLLTNGNSVTVLSPCRPQDYPAVLRQHIKIVPWEKHGATLAVGEKGEREQHGWIGTLLTLVSPAIRIEPQLLRSMRFGLGFHGHQVPAAVESLVWQHPSIKEPHSVAASWEPYSSHEERLKKFAELEPDDQRLALRKVLQWRTDLPAEIWFEELINIDSLIEIDTIFKGEEQRRFRQDIQAACQFLQQIVKQEKLYGVEKGAYRSWAARLDSRISRKAVQFGKASRHLQHLFYQLNPNSAVSPSGHVIDPGLYPPPPGESTQVAWLCQRGNKFGVSRYDPFKPPGENSSVMGVLHYKGRGLKFIYPDGTSHPAILPNRLSDTMAVVYTVEEVVPRDPLTIKTDETELVLVPMERPQWANRVGRDHVGLYADLSIDKKRRLLQRFRWIAPGEFMMGSPNTEEDRYNNEDYHKVSLTQGYWLADTTVTQELWQAVMDENPSRFKGEKRPVENVSWDDTKKFIRKLENRIPGLPNNMTLRLPSEAEWEHGCRAGTKTPYSFGKSISHNQVNYGASSRNKTVEVSSLPPNSWGLYEMHGNVWEWCEDYWQDHLGSEPVVDPFVNEGSPRVLRGGSWFRDGRFVRSAFRHHVSPGFRGDGVGFRLALGRELKVRQHGDKKG